MSDAVRVFRPQSVIDSVHYREKGRSDAVTASYLIVFTTGRREGVKE